MITTITAYWNRPEMLRSWVASIKGATFPGLRHLIYFVGEAPPSWWEAETSGTSITAMVREEKPGLSIAHYHNLGAQQANTEWIMKIDVDTLPHYAYFHELVPILTKALPKEWFNGGMFYMNKFHSSTLLSNRGNLPLSVANYQVVMRNARSYSASSYLLPAATNFVCRRETYLSLGGACPGFRGYGWEDYQQIFMLEAHQTGRNPLSKFLVTMENVTRLCRDEISRRKARELYERNPLLCLIHKYHPGSSDVTYRAHMEENRKILFDYVMSHAT